MFPARLLDLMFSTKKCFTKTVDLGTPFKIQWPPKWNKKSSIFSNLPNSSIYLFSTVEGFIRDLFSYNHSNCWAVWTEWVLKAHFVDADWLISCLFCFSLCHIAYNIFINDFHNTTVNAQPSSPQLFL